MEKSASSSPVILCRFKDKHPEMAICELLSLFELFGCTDVKVDHSDLQPFVHLTGVTDKTLFDKVCSRSMLVNGFYEVFGEGR